jgi:NitT/TauT family transport system substrate-binding protein
MRTRPTLLVLASLLVLSCAPKKEEKEPTLPKIRVITDWYANTNQGGFYAALAHGRWKEQGLDVELVQGSQNPQIDAKVSLDANAVGMLRADMVLKGIERGHPLIAVANYLQHEPQGVMVRADSPVKSFADLQNRTLAAVPGEPFVTYLFNKYHLTNMHLSPATGTTANFIRDPQYIQQAYLTNEPYYAEKANIPVRFLYLSESGFDPYNVVVANTKLVQEHPELIRSFCKGLYLGYQDFFKDPTLTYAALKKVNPDLQDDIMHYNFNVMKNARLCDGDPAKGESFGDLKPERWATLQTELLATKLLDAPIAPEKAYTADFTPEKLGLPPIHFLP